MESFVSNIFKVLGWSVFTVLLYVLLFGNTSLTGEKIFTNADFRGTLWFASEAVEEALAKQYYDYCYYPAMRRSDNLADDNSYYRRNTGYACGTDINGNFYYSANVLDPFWGNHDTITYAYDPVFLDIGWY